MIVRPATAADIPACVQMGAKFYATTSYTAMCDYDREAAANVARLLLDSGVLLVADDDGELIGMVGMILSPFVLNPQFTVAYEVMWWVAPDARCSGAGAALVRAVEPACKEKGADAVQQMHLADSPPVAGLMFKRLGYRHTETVYTKALN
jgi:predicted N-acetyltransferase YhbS